MKIINVTLSLLFVVAMTGCRSPNVPDPHPLKGWVYRPFDEYASPREQRGYKLDPAIQRDFEKFVKSFGKSWQLDQPLRGFYEDGKGNRAIGPTMYNRAMFEGRLWRYILFYDQADHRTKKIRFIESLYGPFDF